jgi:hypothetical protein
MTAALQELEAECLVKDIHPSERFQPMPCTARIW